MARGLAYGVGVGPGDPELMTLKAARTIRACSVVAVPGGDVSESLAYRIALAAIPDVAHKELVALPSPMTRDHARVRANHAANARALEAYLDAGLDVAVLTLGDPSLYSTFAYLRRALEADGYATQTIAGVPSFCAAAACMGTSLVEGDKPLHVVPAARIGEALSHQADGTYVVMKAGRPLERIKAVLREAAYDAWAVERCGMEGQRTYPSLGHMPDEADYLTVVVAKSR